jgi:sigma-B regulation protein RsbU (phosphoserine phosphatase)
VNAGHNPPFVCTPEGMTQLPTTGRPIGILPEAVYTEETVTLGHGATLVLYTDGLNEAANPEEEEYGNDRLASLVREATAYEVDAVPSRVLDAIMAFEDGAHATDDKTLVVVRRR